MSIFRTVNLTTKLLCTGIMLFCCVSATSTEAVAQEIQPYSETPIEIGTTITFQSSVLHEERELNIHVPPGYSPDSLKTYPVIYLLDGSLDEDFIHISGLVQFGSFSWIQMVPESIVVGITNVDRQRDFTFPTKNKQDQEDFPTSGGSADFIRFIEEEVHPLVRSAYKVSDTETLIGQSLGGLLATEILYTKPYLFDHYIIVSPSLWWNDESMLAKEPSTPEGVQHIYIAVGKEGEFMERTARELYEQLSERTGAATSLHFNFLEARDHGDALHLAVYHAFEEIFGTKKH